MIGFFDNEETIGEQAVRAMAEAEADHKAFGDELQLDATALLATVRHLLTGHELKVLEAASDIHNSDGIDVSVIASLRIQFAREIAAWKDGVKP